MFGSDTNPWIAGNRAFSIWFEDALFRFKDPMMSSSATFYEGRPWWVGSRDPFVQGFKWSWGEFFGGRRPAFYSEGTLWLTALTTTVSYAYLKDLFLYKFGNLGMSEQAMTGRNYRPTHPWAMRRLSALRIVRPVTLAALWTGSYLFPRSFVEQNWGRQNQPYHLDLTPHLAGTLGCVIGTQLLFGSAWRVRSMFNVLGLGALIDANVAMGGTIFDTTREATYPRVLASVYGLPNGGEGYEAVVDGELSTTWRLESEVERGLTSNKVDGLKQLKLIDGHPLLEQNYGHFWMLHN